MNNPTKIAALLQTSPQTETSFYSQRKNIGVDDTFEKSLEDASKSINQEKGSSSNLTNQQNVAKRKKTNSKESQTSKTQTRKASSKSKSEVNEKAEIQKKERSFRSKLETSQKASIKSNSVNNKTLNTSVIPEELVFEKLQGFGLNTESIQKFLSLFNSNNLAIEETDLNTLSASDLNVIQIGSLQSIMANKGTSTADISLREQKAVNFLCNAGLSSENARNLVRQLMQISEDAKNPGEANLKPTDFLPTEESKAGSELKLNSTKENRSVGKKHSGENNLKIISKQSQNEQGSADEKHLSINNLEINSKKVQKENRPSRKKGSKTNDFTIISKDFKKEVIQQDRISLKQNQTVGPKSDNNSRIRLPEVTSNLIKSVQIQQNVPTDTNVQASGLNFQNNQDTFTLFQQNLAKTPIEGVFQHQFSTTENFSNTLQEIKSNQTTLPKGIGERSIVDQVVQKFIFRGGDSNNEIKMRLEPPSLGTVRMSVSTQSDIVRTVIIAENQAVKQILENNLSQLKDSFSGQGLKIESFQVMVGGEPGFKDQQQHQQKLDNHYHSRTDSGEPIELEVDQYPSLGTSFSRGKDGFSVIA